MNDGYGIINNGALLPKTARKFKELMEERGKIRQFIVAASDGINLR